MTALDKNFGYEIFNLGNSNPIELNYFVSLLEKNLGKKARIKYGEKRQEEVEITFADLRKSEKMLGYKPKVKVEEGVKRLVKWYKQK